jgi:hypothetical protein
MPVHGRFAPTAVIRQLTGTLIYPAKKLQAAVASLKQTCAIPKTYCKASNTRLARSGGFIAARIPASGSSGSADNYSVLTLRSSITLRHEGISAAMMADSSAGVLAVASTP